jgi:hypothetical protein
MCLSEVIKGKFDIIWEAYSGSWMALWESESSSTAWSSILSSVWVFPQIPFPWRVYCIKNPKNLDDVCAMLNVLTKDEEVSTNTVMLFSLEM